VTFVLLIILAVVWAVYLVSWARSRTEHRSVNSISTFSKHLSVLERTTPGWASAPTRIAGSPAPQRATVSLARPAFAPTAYRPAGSPAMTRQQARERRKNVLFGLAGGVLVTLALTVVLGGPFLYLQLLADALLVGYVVLLAQTQRIVVERQSKVRYLQQPVEYHDRAPMLLRTSVN
jgi:Flp pilus assembly protein TadB